MSIALENGLLNQSLDRVLEDVLTRFVINALDEDLSTNARIFFLFEEAHWFYLDFIRQINPYLPNLKMKQFSQKLIELFPLIWKGGDPIEGLKEFSNYKQSIPVRGAAIFNESLDKLLIVQGMESNKWSFPRGKISKDENDVDCAIREVKEEIGFDLTPFIRKQDFIERNFKAKNYKIFIAKNVPEDTDFKPLARNEIAKIKWISFKKLIKDIKSNSTASKYFIIPSMINPLISYVKRQQSEINEAQLKKDAEIKLKFLLGLNSPKTTTDPGRDLLEFIKQSAANKQIKDQQQLQTFLQQQQQQQQQQFNPYSFMPMPFYPMPMPFMPPPLPMSGPNSRQMTPQPIPPMMVPMLQPPVPSSQQQQQPQQPPQPPKLNEFLSILNSNTTVKKEKEVKQKKENDYSKNLLNLLKKSPATSPVPTSAEILPKSEKSSSEPDIAAVANDSVNENENGSAGVSANESANENTNELSEEKEEEEEIEVFDYTDESDFEEAQEYSDEEIEEEMEEENELKKKPTFTGDDLTILKRESKPPITLLKREDTNKPGQDLLNLLKNTNSAEQVPSRAEKPAEKPITMLKRENNTRGQDLLGLLMNPKTEPKNPPITILKRETNNPGQDLMNLLKKPQAESSDSTVSEKSAAQKPVTILKRETNKPGEDLLNMLKPQKTEPSAEKSQQETAKPITILKREDSNKPGQDLLNLLKNPKASESRESINSEKSETTKRPITILKREDSASTELLNMIKKPEAASKPQFTLLKRENSGDRVNPSPASPVPVAAPAPAPVATPAPAPANNPGQDLLNLLKSPKTDSTARPPITMLKREPLSNSSAGSSGNNNPGQELLNLLKPKEEKPKEEKPNPGNYLLNLLKRDNK